MVVDLGCGTSKVSGAIGIDRLFQEFLGKGETISDSTPPISFLEKMTAACFVLFVLACNFSISLTQITGYSGVVLWLIQTYRSRSWNRTKWILIWPFTILFMAGLLSTLTAVDPVVSLPYLKKFTHCLLFYWVINTLGQTRFIEFFIWLSLFLKPQQLQNKISNWLVLHRETPSALLIVNILIIAGTVSACLGLYQVFFLGIGLDSRLDFRGTMSHIFTFSAILMMVGLVAFARLILGRHGNIWLYASSSLIAICLILTLTRQIWVGMFVSIALLIYIRKKILIIAFPILLTVAFFLSPPLIQERVQSIADLKDASTILRLQMWNASLDVIKDYPLTGCGYDCLYLIHDQYPQHPILQEFYYNLHSNLFQITVDSGLLGLGAWSGLWIAYFIVVYRKSRQPSLNDPPQWIRGGSSAAVLAFLIAGLFETNFYDSEVVMVLYFIMALPFVSFNTSQSTPSESAAPLHPQEDSQAGTSPQES